MAAATLAEIAVRFGLELRGDPDATVASVGTLGGAGPGQLAFLANPRLLRQLGATRAGAVVLAPALAGSCPTSALLSPYPHAAFARIAAWLHPAPAQLPGIHASAVVAPDALVDPSASIGPLAVIGARSRIGARAVVGPGSVVGDDVELDADVQLVARVTVHHGVSIGARSILHPGSVVGADGFGYGPEQRHWIKVPQIGTVRVGVDVEIGANTTIDRGAIEDTVIGDGVKIDNQVQIGHNCRIGAHTAIAGCVGIAGSAVIGAHCQIAGGVGIAGHLSICDDVVLTAASLVFNDISEPGIYSSGIPVEKTADWRKVVARLKRIDGLARRVNALERSRGVPQDTEEDDA
jgi:UDP-3-O-[3-hydroxymyristoyl] glucosamine N-acyltransferase